jgi:hypothetical protein
VLNFTYSGGAGIYRWPVNGNCVSSPGSLTFTAGDFNG